MNISRFALLAAVGGSVFLSGCSSSTSKPPVVPVTPPPITPPPPPPSVVSQLATMTTIGSTVDPINGDANPYGLQIAPLTVGLMKAGDLVVCNFNDVNGTSGAGTTIEDLAPVAGSKPMRLSQDASLAGCNSLAINPGAGFIWTAAYTANDNPIFAPTGGLAATLAKAYPWQQPWGQIYGSPTPAAGATGPSPAAFYISNAGDGSIVQASITSTGLQFRQIITGFPHSVDPKYGILAPAGLTYDPATDTLYVVSSQTNSVLAFSKVSTIPQGGVGITFTPATGGSYTTGTASSFSFGGPSNSQAKVIFTGTPLNYPISSALLYNGDLIVGNTGDNNMVEISPSTGLAVGMKSVDSGNAGAIFGIATSGTSLMTQKIYFNDDNANSVVLLSQ
jgi:hypothetical protein